jgi:hypothetical protein
MADTGTGVTISFATSGFTAQLTGAVESDGVERQAIDVTHHASATYMQYIPAKLIELGEVTFEFLFNPDSQPPIGGATETITITFPLPAGQSTPADLEFDGFLTAWTWGAPLEEAMTGEGTIKLAGGTYVWTASAS